VKQLRRSLGLEEEDPNRIPSLEQKIQMTYDLFKIGWLNLHLSLVDSLIDLDATQLGRLLTLIEKNCPRAILRVFLSSTSLFLLTVTSDNQWC
jgi:hypothetical protein